MQPLVSIWCPTFNHEKYISKCIEGFVMQKTNFDFEVIIHDDASSDNNSNIIREFQKKYPDLLVCIFQKDNQYSRDKAFLIKTMIQTAKGKYIAMCEGDDYWTDSCKLQKQVDFLEQNNEIVLCCHNNHIVDENNERIYEDFFIKENSILNTKNLLGNTYYNIIPTASVVFRNVLKNINLQFISICPFGDFPLYIELSRYGNIYFDKNVYSIYRRNGQGISSSLTKLQQLNDIIEFYTLVKVFHPEHTKTAVEKINYIHNLIEGINIDNINNSLEKQKKELVELYTSDSILLKNISFWYLCRLIFKKMIGFLFKKNN
jgi:glycosyltransferase involved in cell wall biosynthesis